MTQVWPLVGTRTITDGRVEGVISVVLSSHRFSLRLRGSRTGGGSEGCPVAIMTRGHGMCSLFPRQVYAGPRYKHGEEATPIGCDLRRLTQACGSYRRPSGTSRRKMCSRPSTSSICSPIPCEAETTITQARPVVRRTHDHESITWVNRPRPVMSAPRLRWHSRGGRSRERRC